MPAEQSPAPQMPSPGVVSQSRSSWQNRPEPAMQALVIAHAAYGHNAFFKGNELFRAWWRCAHHSPVDRSPAG